MGSWDRWVLHVLNAVTLPPDGTTANERCTPTVATSGLIPAFRQQEERCGKARC